MKPIWSAAAESRFTGTATPLWIVSEPGAVATGSSEPKWLIPALPLGALTTIQSAVEAGALQISAALRRYEVTIGVVRYQSVFDQLRQMRQHGPFGHGMRFG